MDELELLARKLVKIKNGEDEALPLLPQYTSVNFESSFFYNGKTVIEKSTNLDNVKVAQNTENKFDSFIHSLIYPYS